MIRHIVLTSVSVIALTVAASAAAPPPVADWSGLYVGGHIGGAWGRDHVVDEDGLNGGHTFNITDTSIIAGGDIGYNWESSANWRGDAWVLGLEADLGGIGFSKRKFDPGFPGGTFSGIESGFYGDVTGRLGYSFGPVLAYFKGGFAFYDGDAFVDNTCGGCIFGGGRAKTPGLFAGDTVGAGLEYQYDSEWSVKVEYLHFDFGTQTATLHTIFGPFRYSNGLTADTVSVGVNFKLGPDIL